MFSREEALKVLDELGQLEVGNYIPPMPLIHKHPMEIMKLEMFIYNHCRSEMIRDTRQQWQSFHEQYSFHTAQFKTISKMMGPTDFFDSYSKLEFVSLYLNECNNSKIVNDSLRTKVSVLKKRIKVLETELINE